MFTQMSCLIKFKVSYRDIIRYKEFKRYAGHSKWKNTKHIKATMDQKKSNLSQDIVKRMTFAVQKNKSADPFKNSLLAKIIAEAKKKSVPMLTITNALTRLQKFNEVKTVIFISKGPSETVIILHLKKDEQALSNINSILKKSGFSICQIPKSEIIKETGTILTEINNHEEDKIIEDAIEVGADNVEKLRLPDEDVYQFTCSPLELAKVQNKLEKINYKIIQTEIEYIPQVFVTLKDADLDVYNHICNQLNVLDVVIKLKSNVL